MSETASVGAAARKPRVLVVEDDWLIADSIREELQNLGNDVVGPVSSVRDALTLVENESIDVALLDFRLNSETSAPVADECVRRQIPYAFLTGYSALDLPSHLRESVLLKKPVEPRELTSMLGRLVGEKV